MGRDAGGLRQYAQAAIREKRALVALRDVPFVAAVLGLTLGGGRPGFLIELAEGGELFAGLQDGAQAGGTGFSGGASGVGREPPQAPLVARRFAEEAVKFYAAELTVCLEGIHRQGYVYRDLKPENVVLTRAGHVRLVDFGFAEPTDRNGRVKGRVGTREFLSPEALMP